MITPDGHICLIDFGIARHFKPGQTNDTARFYSVGYAPPEQYGQLQTSPRSDIYSLGATLHQMLSGHNPSHQPFQFPPLQIVDPTIPATLARLVMQMVDLDELKRPAHVSMVKQQLEQVLILRLSEVTGSIWVEPTSDMLEEVNPLLLLGQSPFSRHTSPDSYTAAVRSRPTQPLPGKGKKSKAQPLARRSMLIGLLGGIIATSGGAFALSYYLMNTEMTENRTRRNVAGSTALWTGLQQIAGQASKTAPALAGAANEILYLVFMANNDGNGLLYISSPDGGTTWSNYGTIPGQASKTAPALAVAPNGTLYLVFVANNDGNGLLYISSQDGGAMWGNYGAIPEQESKTAPALAIAKDGTLHLAFVANNIYNSLLYISSQDGGATWGNYGTISGQASETAPALAVAPNGTLCLAFVANNGDNNLLYMSSQDNGVVWSSVYDTGQSSLLAPALAFLNNKLYLAFVANDGSNQLCVISSQDGGVHWTSKQEIGQPSLLAPALAVLNNKLYLAFVANDGSNQFRVISSPG